MNFKGTKGPWVVRSGSMLKGIFYKDQQIGLIQGLDREANALLISKAPELLEKLEESLAVIKWYMENTKPENDDYDTFFNLGANQISSTEQLIKEATTI